MLTCIKIENEISALKISIDNLQRTTLDELQATVVSASEIHNIIIDFATINTVLTPYAKTTLHETIKHIDLQQTNIALITVSRLFSTSIHAYLRLALKQVDIVNIRVWPDEATAFAWLANRQQY